MLTNTWYHASVKRDLCQGLLNTHRSVNYKPEGVYQYMLGYLVT